MYDADAVGCEVVGAGLVDFGVMVLKWDFSFWGCFCLKLGGVEESTSGGEISKMDINQYILGGAGVGNVSCRKSQKSIYSFMKSLNNPGNFLCHRNCPFVL